MSLKVSTTKGISALGILGIILVTLKALNLITISWWWVTLPFWLGPGIFISLFSLYICWYIFILILAYFTDKKKKK